MLIDDDDVKDNPDKQRFELEERGLGAFANYRRQRGACSSGM